MLGVLIFAGLVTGIYFGIRKRVTTQDIEENAV